VRLLRHAATEDDVFAGAQLLDRLDPRITAS
jgi:hypothetical protein